MRAALLLLALLGLASAQRATMTPLELPDLLPLLGDLHALELSLNTWLPLAVYQPHIPVNEGYGGMTPTNLSTWLGVFIFFGEAGVTASEPGIGLLETNARFRSLFGSSE